MNQPTLLSAIARWIVSADFPDLPDGEIAAARAALTDFVAVAAAGSGTSVVRTCKSSKDHSKPRNEVDTSLKSPV